ncbi:cysteine proteinase [Serendipita vermifera]|nr:cysteine proteinase [Serendipita vermifera]
MSTNQSLVEAEALLAKAKKKELARDWNVAYQSYILAAKSLMSLIERTKNNSVKSNASKSLSLALDRASKLKAAHPEVKPPVKDMHSEEEQLSVLASSARICGFTYQDWEDSRHEKTDTSRYIDAHPPALGTNDTWADLEGALGAIPMVNPNMLPSEITQSIIPNCSVVSSIIVCWNHHLRHDSKLLLSQLYPQESNQFPVPSMDHRYTFKMLANGSYKRVSIDDRIPMHESKYMCITSNPSPSIWPVLVEKAYMKVNGGYDFAGSDSGVDLRALVGWIPDQQSFQDASFEREKMWKTIIAAFIRGQLLITLGTSDSVPSSNDLPQLLPLHSYACIDLQDSEERLLSIINPWVQARSIEHGSPRQISSSLQSIEGNERGSESKSNCWNLTWEDVCSLFDSIYLSWNPAMFKYSISHHRIWKAGSGVHDVFDPNLNHQIIVSLDRSYQAGEIWALLSRHTVNRNEHTVYIALHAFEQNETGVSFIKPDNLTIKGRYQEGQHCLIKLVPDKLTKLISLITSLNFPDLTKTRDVSYTLTLYSNQPLSYETPSESQMISKTSDTEFNARTSGGHIGQSTFFKNPQWSLKLLPSSHKNSTLGNKATRTRVVLRGFAAKELPLNVKVYRSGEKRINSPKDGMLVFDSGVYNYGMAFGQVDLLADNYIVILSNYSVNQHGKARLFISSPNDFVLEQAPSEGAGMYLKTFRGRWEGESAAGKPGFKRYWANPTFEVNLQRTTKLILHLQAVPKYTNLPLNLALFKCEANQDKTEVATSGPYVENLYGVRASCLVPPGSFIVVVSTVSPGIYGEFELLVWSDSSIQISAR